MHFSIGFVLSSDSKRFTRYNNLQLAQFFDSHEKDAENKQCEEKTTKFQTEETENKQREEEQEKR